MAAEPSGNRDFPDVPLRRLVTYRLSRLNAQLNAQAARILKETAGLSLAQWRILVVTEALGRLPPADISRATGVDKGQLSRTLKGMVADGLILSEGSESDHRSHLLSLTDKGHALFEAARSVMRGRQAFLSESLSVQEREILFRALDKIEIASKALEEEG